MPNNGDVPDENTGEEESGEESPDELTTLKSEMVTLKAMLTALTNPSEEEEEGEEEEEEEIDDKDKDKSKTKSKKLKPHAHTIKLAESLKLQMGKIYVKEWDKIPINERISKMETIMEFNANLKKNSGVKEGKLPKGSPDSNKASVYKGRNGLNYKARADKLANR